MVNKEAKPVSIYEMPDGKKMVRVKTLDEDFLLDTKHIDNGKWYEFGEAMKRLKELGLTTFNKKQSCIISTYNEEIDEVIKVLDGDKLNWEWTVDEYVCNNSWYYNGYYDTVSLNHNDNKSKVRPIYAVKK